MIFRGKPFQFCDMTTFSKIWPKIFQIFWSPCFNLCHITEGNQGELRIVAFAFSGSFCKNFANIHEPLKLGSIKSLRIIYARDFEMRFHNWLSHLQSLPSLSSMHSYATLEAKTFSDANAKTH
jgi:hypothetical protein